MLIVPEKKKNKTPATDYAIIKKGRTQRVVKKYGNRSHHSEMLMREYMQAQVAIREMVEHGMMLEYIADITGLSVNIVRNCYNNVSNRFQAYDTGGKIMVLYEMWKQDEMHDV
jgi:hypothetical protein